MNGLSVVIIVLLGNLSGLELALVIPQVTEQSPVCGKTDITQDVRTQAPYIVSIYIRLRKNSKRVKFLTTGVVTSPTVISTFFGGTLEMPPDKYRGLPTILPKPEDFVIVTALNSTNLHNMDQFSEIIQVDQVQPYSGVHESWKRFHFVFLHLKYPLNFSSYLRPPCVRFPERIRELTEKGKAPSLYPENVYSVLAGHSYPSKNGHYDLLRIRVKILSIHECQKHYWKYYEAALPASITCAQSSEPETPGSTLSCLQPNGVRFDKLFGSKDFITGEIAMVPDRKMNICTKETIYFAYIPSLAESDWFAKSIRCSPKFACFKGTSECLDWSNVCDSVNDCGNAEDEDDAFCSRTFGRRKKIHDYLILS